MLSEFLVYLRLGLTHVADIQAYDHILFIAALCAGYGLREWKRLFWLATAFTIGHSITLALATLRIIVVDDALIELLIPITIVFTSLVNIAVPPKHEKDRSEWGKYLMALGFGLIHGMGFSNFLRAVLGIGGAARQLHDVHERQSKAFQAVAGSGPPSLRKMEAALAAVREKVGQAGEFRLVSALARWKELMDLAPDRDGIQFRKIDISARRLSVEAEVSGDDIATEFRERLGRSKMFEPEPFTLDPDPHGGGSTYIMKMDVRYGR